MKNASAAGQSPGELLRENPTKPEEFDLRRWSIGELKKLTGTKLHRFTQGALRVRQVLDQIPSR